MYVDGFVVAVPLHRKDEYIKTAQHFAQMFKTYGAQRVVECWAENVPDGALTSFPMAVKLEEGEAVCFSWIEFPDKATRDRCHETVMNDKGFMAIEDMPFDGARMIYGGFDVIIDER